MIVNFSLVNELFRAFYIQRWNDRVRPMNLVEMDKHAHKLLVAYCLGKYEESRGNVVDWQFIIRDCIYEMLRRIIISDIKSPILNEIKKHTEVFARLNEFVYKELEPKIESEEIKAELKDFLFTARDRKSDLNCRIIDAAHIYISYWEFDLIVQANPKNFQNNKILTSLNNRVSEFSDLLGIDKLLNNHTISNFIDLFGQMRFQLRWAQIPRVPQTSVLGHSMMVACISYFFARENGACPKRLYNAFFGGLFHDLPEAVTRDIISPVKRSSPEFDNLIKDLESELADKEIFPLIEKEWWDEVKYFIIDEFSNKVMVDGKLISSEMPANPAKNHENPSIEDLNEKYNEDQYNPFDGELIRAADQLAAFLEAWNSCSAGIKTEEISRAALNIKDMYRDKTIGKTSVKSLYSYFKHPC